MWEHVMTHLESDPLKLRTEVDWVIKYHLIEAYRERHDLPLTHPRVALLDLAYHDVTRPRSLYYLLERRGQVDRTATDEEIETAVDTPPQTTRARLRGAFIKRAKERKRDYTVDWVHLKLNDQAQRTVLCKDPFKSRDERVERLIASLVADRVPSFRTGQVVAAARGADRAAARRGRPRRRARARVRADRSSPAPVALGDHVVVNTTAVELGLGTGGWHVVHWNLARDEWSEKGPGHIIKGRYTSLQADVGSTEEHLDAARRRRVDRRHARRRRRAAQPAPGGRGRGQGRARPTRGSSYVMTDGAALPLALSDLVAELARPRRCIDATITCGHAFGGDYEAVSVFSALAVARHVADADVAVVAMGPGIVGTEHPARLQRHRGRARPRRGGRARRRADRRAARVVRRSARAPPSASRTTARPRCGSRAASACVVAVPCVGGAEEARLRADLAAAGHRRAPRARRRRRRPTSSSSSRRTTSTSSRWAGPRPTTRCCSRPRPPPGVVAVDRSLRWRSARTDA